MKKDNKVKEVTDTPWNPFFPLSRTSLRGLPMRKREKEIVFCRAIRLRSYCHSLDPLFFMLSRTGYRDY